MEANDVVFVARDDAVLTDSTTSSDIAGKAAVEVSHGVSVLLGDCKKTLSLSLCHVESNSITILLVA